MRLDTASPGHALDLAPLRVGSMLVITPGSRMRLPGLPDLPIQGHAWVVESTTSRLRFHEVARVGGLPATFDMSLTRVGQQLLDYTVETRVLGVALPTARKRYEIVDAGRGWLQLRNPTDARERHSTLRMTPDGLRIDVVGPWGLVDDRTEPVIQPGQPGYRMPPRSAH